MAFLLDTNVISETVRPRPDKTVLNRIESRNPRDLFLAAQAMGELVRGARRVREQSRREQFERWIEHDLARQFNGRILSFDASAAALWGRLMGGGSVTFQGGSSSGWPAPIFRRSGGSAGREIPPGSSRLAHHASASKIPGSGCGT